MPDNSTPDDVDGWLPDLADILLFYPGAYREPFLPEPRRALAAKRTPEAIAFSAAELDVITRLAASLEPELRDPFRRAIAIELGRAQAAPA